MQKSVCEKNHFEIRKVLPKRISFEKLTKRQCTVLMSHINSEPRPSLGGLCTIQLFQYAYKDAVKMLLSEIGIEEEDKDNLNLTKDILIW